MLITAVERQRVTSHSTPYRSDLDDAERSVPLDRRRFPRHERRNASAGLGVLESTTGLYGDLQGIAGQALPEIESLDRPLLDAPASSTE
jgi:hypothetical protein